jgi:hypothetical protein
MLIGVLLLAGCVGETGVQSASRGKLALPGTPSLHGLPDLPLPAGKQTAETHGQWEVLDYHAVDFTDDGLILTPLPGELAWAIVDLGSLHPAMNVEGVTFRTAPDWGLQNPPAYAWVGLSNYTRGVWMWRYRDSTAQPQDKVDFSDAPAGTQFTKPDDPKHVYMALVSDHFHVDFGQLRALAARPEIYLSDPPVAVEAGQFNRFMFNPASSGMGDIITYCPGTSEDGGALVRYTHNPDHSASWFVVPLYGTNQPLQHGIRYDMDYLADGRLALLAARDDPSSVIRFVTETSTAGTFNLPDTAVESDFLPTPYIFPYIAMDLDSNGNPHIVFEDKDGVLQYVFRIAGSFAVTSGGYAECGQYCDIAVRNTDIVASFRDTTPSESALSVGSHPISDPGQAWDAKQTVFHEAPKNAGSYTSLQLGPGTRVAIAQYIEAGMINPGGLPPGLAFAYNDSGVISAPWSNVSVDAGQDAATGDKYVAGPHCSLGLLRDGTPVIAYQDQNNHYVRMAVGATVSGSTSADWYKFIVDTGGAGENVGRYISLDVLPGGGGAPDLIGVAYEVQKAGASSLRFALVVWPEP